MATIDQFVSIADRFQLSTTPLYGDDKLQRSRYRNALTDLSNADALHLAAQSRVANAKESETGRVVTGSIVAALAGGIIGAGLHGRNIGWSALAGTMIGGFIGAAGTSIASGIEINRLSSEAATANSAFYDAKLAAMAIGDDSTMRS